ncbi:MAG: hypothetical protein M1133_02390 [Armatimonadetes bacterium]|nr:hypothetical protein [Armatimonadota bacterium]
MTNIVDELTKVGISVWLMDGKVRVFPKSRLTDDLRVLIAANRDALIAEIAEIESRLPRPHLNSCGDVVIPFNSPQRYHWWKGGQSVEQTRCEIELPGSAQHRAEPGEQPE